MSYGANDRQTYVEVIVADASYHGDEPLTYCHTQALARGSIVVVPLRSRLVLGIVTNTVPKPNFAVKPIAEVPDLPLLPAPLHDLLNWMRDYYPSPLGVIAAQFLPKRLPAKPLDSETPKTPTTPSDLPPLTADQKAALGVIASAQSFILHGETGTGKTRVYIELAKQSVSQGKSALILTPEIGLTSQLAADFRSVFGARVIVIHSQLTEVTRQRLWLWLIKQAEPVVVLGARSALFSPIQRLGVIVVDESHEPAYKQDQSPYYHASRVAGQLAALHKATFVLGSATPLVTDYYIAEQKGRPIIRMTKTAVSNDSQDRQVTVVDLKDRTQFTQKPHLSNALITAIGQTLQQKDQVLLFLNRRGTARIVFCTACGWQATCPHCDLPLVYHGDSHSMRCHSCSFKAGAPTSCPECHNVSIVFKSVGTKAIFDEVSRLFPHARIMRFDTDNKKAERMEQHYDALRSGEVDILIGTQTLAKGLDLPQLGLVGILAADTSLYFPDFSAQERTYQLLSQVMGRVARGHRAGSVIVQTYNPESVLLKAIVSKNWSRFYNQEISERERFLFPPFCYLLKLTCRRATVKGAAQASELLARQLHSSDLKIAVEGPTPAFHEKIQNKYQWQLVVKSKDRSELLKIIKRLPSGWSYDIDPMNLL
jgi:primosomal protein N' (replication factor Y)